jgi:hypothetical protein
MPLKMSWKIKMEWNLYGMLELLLCYDDVNI